MLALLSLIEIPPYIEQMYAQYKDLAQTVYGFAEHSGRDERVKGNENLYEQTEEESILYINEGVFRLVIDGNMVRFYSEFDFVVSFGESGINSSLSSDFAADVTVFDKHEFFDTIKGDHAILEKWTALMDLEIRINLFLASAYMQQIVVPNFMLQGYEKGDIIINEGDESMDIFEMVSGSAEASKDGSQLGIINEGEVFGEVSFFTGSRRTATVRALKKCLVRVIHEENFSDMIRHNPKFIISISKTLAKRIVRLNKKFTQNMIPVNVEIEVLEE